MSLLEWKHSLEDSLSAEKGSKRQHTRVFHARSDNPDADATEITSDPQVPQQMTVDPYDRGCLVLGVQARRMRRSKIWWTVTITSTTEVDRESANPLAARAKWSARSILYEIPIVKDYRGRPVRNTAGDYFEGAKTSVVGWTFTASKSLPDAPLGWIDDFVSAVNDSTITIRGKRCGPKTVWLREVEIGEPRDEFNVTHCPSRFVFEYNPLGWLFEPLNMGYRELVEVKRRNTAGQVVTVRELRQIVDGSGRPVSKPKLLDRSGRVPRIVGADGREVHKEPLDESDIVVLSFEIKRPRPFGRLAVLA